VLKCLSYILRLTDKWLGTSLTRYGWAMYFGNTGAVDTRTRTNVCVRCGSGHSAEALRQANLVTRFGFLQRYRCPGCGAANLFLEDGS